jgi:SagB-type dehydrogenase family enzyme
MEQWPIGAAVAFVISAVLDRSRVKYGDRGYRYALIESGHVGQNMALLATELGLGCCSVGGFIDDDVNKLLDIQLQSEYALYMVVIGSPRRMR